MLLVDNIDNNASFNSQMRAGNGNVSLRAYATSGMVADTPYAVQWMGSGYNATILAASIYAYVGVPEGGKAVASGCMGWVQVRGYRTGVQGGTTDFMGSQGHSIFWGAAALGASTSAYQGLLHQVGVLMEDLGGGASTTANIYLTGIWATPQA